MFALVWLWGSGCVSTSDLHVSVMTARVVKDNIVGSGDRATGKPEQKGAYW